MWFICLTVKHGIISTLDVTITTDWVDAHVLCIQVEKDSSCVVFGLGAVGLAAVMGCQIAGAKRIIAVDINPEKFAKAKVLGATDFVNATDHTQDIQNVIVEKTSGGVDYAIECVGNPDIMVGVWSTVYVCLNV